jgi:hypothetical protein
MWKYWWYGDPNGPDPWRAWYDDQNAAVRARHDNVFRFLESRESWVGTHAKKIDDFVEVILSTRVEHRLLGCYWPPAKCCFTFVMQCTHKGKVYKPKNAFETAGIRIRELKNGSTWMRRCVRPE